MTFCRRILMLLTLGLALGLAAATAHGQAAAFGFEDVARQAQALAAQAWRPPPPPDARRAALDYDAVRRIRFRARHALWRGSPFEMHFFPVAGYHTRALALFEIVDGQARPLRLPADAFDLDGVLPPAPAGTNPTVAGWRLTFPLHGGAKRDEVVAFLGASYFRALGTDQRYGLSARALAVDTVGGAAGEEFPHFTHFWFEPPAAGARHLVFHALLDGPRVAGAYRFELHPGTTTRVEVRARLFLREAVAMLGIAPLTSMYLHGELQPRPDDFRPEVHDSDGLQIEAANGEWLWRPLANPRTPFVSAFAFERAPKGFGLMQRDRAFASYEDVEARYDRRPSAWVEPVGDWGAGRVELLQFNTPDETHDNVAAYWVPTTLPAPGAAIDLAWRVRWQGDASRVPPGARVVQTRSGFGYTKTPLPPQRRKLLLDFAGAGLPAADASPDDAAVKAIEAVATLGNGNARLLRVNAYPNPALPGWRATVEFERIDPTRPVELRVFLRNGANAISETWSYALPPD
jgi:glucans biosynthesis protein